MLLTEILKRSSVVCYYFVTVKPGALVVFREMETRPEKHLNTGKLQTVRSRKYLLIV